MTENRFSVMGAGCGRSARLIVHARRRHVARQQIAKNPRRLTQHGLHLLLAQRVRLIRRIEKLDEQFKAALMQDRHHGSLPL